MHEEEVGSVYGNLRILSIERGKKPGNNTIRYWCECECLKCGAIGTTSFSRLKSGATTRCSKFPNNKWYDENLGCWKYKACSGDVLLIDPDDVDLIGEKKAYKSREYWYVNNGKGNKTCLHREIGRRIGIKTRIVDHSNRDQNDCRRKNLRPATSSQNNMNCKPRGLYRKKSKYKGVSIHKSSGLWFSRIRVDGSVIHLGYYKNEIEAAKAYDIAADKHFKEYACTNSMLGLL